MLELDGISRSFDGRRVLDGISFNVEPGRLTGFVGSNGAGKTTTMRIVLGILAPDAGTVIWKGRPADHEARRQFGYMPEERGLYPKMNSLDQLVFLARLHGLDAAGARRKAVGLLEQLGLGERMKDKLESLSLGNQQRVQVAAALIHDPVLLVLDEPFSGLDPVTVDTMTTILRTTAAGGVPVLFSSHQLDLVERICDDLVIIAGGGVVARGTVAELRNERAGARYRLVLGDDAGWLRDLDGIEVLDVDGPRALVELPDVSHDQRLLTAAVQRGPVHEFSRVVPALADIYREVSK
ncbi:ATP-binding cassette domain-containing protein [Kineosporia sp. J2-2]|uniref:ATP-binding cassette domain-containing protein n=1 Tax=Kineosporia corallincola TaxID=2835133 RepID=A0ABS5TSL9_9ACTN|nr:ATP-binding cassette domain-containing protein [Kineosporia corallincola]MBT0773816.1 ATP-binding cassette domain-containing protein [Kineosporia corallincola]